MDLTDYPNLQAVFDGRVSRAHDEWPQVRVELRQLLNAATARERLLMDQKALTENAWKVANDQARQREDLESRRARLVAIIQRRQPVGSSPPGDEARLAEWVFAHLEKELALWKESADSMKAARHAACHDIARLEEEKAQLQRYPFEPICLICGRLTPCMTEADLKPGDPGVPCTFDPTPKQLFEENAYLRERLARAEAREAAMRKYVRHDPECKIDYTKAVRVCTCGLAAALSDAGRELAAGLTNAYVRIEDLEHEVGALREKLRRIKGYVNSVVWEE